jgi:uncharacterized radical SAM superfamily Fe-S cluster-containing enzyme
VPTTDSPPGVAAGSRSPAAPPPTTQPVFRRACQWVSRGPSNRTIPPRARLRVLGSTSSLRESGRAPLRWPTYLRVIVNAVCPLACSFCHREGDPAVEGRERGLGTGEWIEVLTGAVDAGVRKVKLLGGEPLLRTDLNERHHAAP